MPPASQSILVVDDDAGIRQLVRQALEKAGYPVVCVPDARGAIRALAQDSYKVVVTDLLMPDMDGLELIEQLRRRHPLARIVAMSGGGRIAPEEYLQIARGLGANALLGKPFTPRQLLSAIEEALAV